MFTPLDTACANILDYSSKYFCDFSDYSHHLAQRSEGAPGDALLAPGRAGGRALAVTRHASRGGRAVGGLLVSWGLLGGGGGLHLHTAQRAQISCPLSGAWSPGLAVRGRGSLSPPSAACPACLEPEAGPRLNTGSFTL